ncbi:MAG: hypothetical protein SPI77_01830 [Corynebacterium sp.]|nr:hypothetical protein [Corynebacterium sp.]
MTAPSSPYTSPSEPIPAIVTMWFVSASDPAAALTSTPAPDRGFGRKLLGQLYPGRPITTIGSFPLGRSTYPGASEYYIGGFPGVSVISTCLADARTLSNLPAELLGAVGAPEVYVFARGTQSPLGGIAHFTAGAPRRVFSATPDYVFENSGLPESFELELWSRESSGIELPFAPQELIPAAELGWLGLANPDVQVIGYATDGRPEPKVTSRAPSPSIRELIATSSAKLGISAASAPYDDYAAPGDADGTDDPPGMEIINWSRRAQRAFTRTLRTARTRGTEGLAAFKEKLRHLDRKT